MSKLKSLIKEQTIEIPFDEETMPGFIVELKYVSRTTLQKMVKKSKKTSFDRQTHEAKEDLDLELFQKLHCDTCVKGWSGLTYEYLAELLVLDLDAIDDMSEEIEYDKDTAYDLISNSMSFDSFVQSVLKDVSFFNKRPSSEIETE